MLLTPTPSAGQDLPSETDITRTLLELLGLQGAAQRARVGGKKVQRPYSAKQTAELLRVPVDTPIVGQVMRAAETLSLGVCFGETVRLPEVQALARQVRQAALAGAVAA